MKTTKEELRHYAKTQDLEYRYCLHPDIEQDYVEIELQRWVGFFDRETGVANGGTAPVKIATFTRGHFELAALAAELFNNEKELTVVLLDDD